MIAPAAASPYLWAAPNKLTVEATLEKIKAEDGPAWLAALGTPSTSLSRRVLLHQAHLERGLPKSILFRVDTKRKVIALTFDDGPHAGWTTKLLDVLRDLDVPATFFVVGKQVEKFPDLARDIDSAGFAIGNHTYDHVGLLKIPPSYIATELLACQGAVRAATGVTPRLFRPPGGEFDKGVAATAAELGCQTVLWTDDPGDFASPPADVIARRTIGKATPGGIILLHDGIESTLDALPVIVGELRKQGYEFVTLEELSRERDLNAKPMLATGRQPITATFAPKNRDIVRPEPALRPEPVLRSSPAFEGLR
jgi:peptidoglycan/xylan/chitin deacetylase (PgdA/CDA1 family)